MPTNCLFGRRSTKLAFNIDPSILSQNVEVSSPDLAVTLAVSVALSIADDACSDASAVPAGSALTSTLETETITELVKQTFIAVAGNSSEFPSHASKNPGIHSVVDECRRQGVRVEAEWVTGRDMYVTVGSKGDPLSRASIAFCKNWFDLDDIPGISGYRPDLVRLCTTYVFE